MLLLIVEDDIDLAAAILDFLELEDIRSDHTDNGETALSLIRQHPYDVIVLDINLPRVSGLEICSVIRNEGNDVPVLMLTAMDTLKDKITGFEKGADDYLIKPFDMEELIIRCRVLAKRRSGQVTQMSVGPLVYKLENDAFYRDGKAIKISPIGMRILEVLMRASPSIVPREKLINDVWGDDAPDSNSLKVHLFNLRKQLDAGFSPKLLHTIPGKGIVLREESSL
ncbi:DNA-binding response OmpR family regulator [Alteromonas sp. 76-1]|jgi:DNA-binding response OmpR family regulator|uniref:response regulator transcription factor n=1 Tax=Alteromonas sp. 76-1 TaxID=2358187 RepID=UPI000FD16014|nr:response regulator transcription factor [Alteromonas sp. 76-1]VEL95360.1 DNA-binding response OmpR family regulator [Alteromonas sp. 76-1]